MGKYMLICGVFVLALGIGLAAQNPAEPPPKTEKNEKKKAKKERKSDKQDKAQEKQEKDKAQKDKPEAEADNKVQPPTEPQQPSPAAAADSNQAVAREIVGRIRDGLETHSRGMLLSAFDPEGLSDYLSFKDQIDAFFDRYEAFRVHFDISQASIEGDKGTVLVDAELEQNPASGGMPVRKRTQLRLEVENGRRGWRVVSISDRGFFS